MYMFPRQFNLHNVFTSEVDRTQTAQKFQDYTLREEEIASQATRLLKVPKRLRGTAKYLVQRLQVRHDRCSYVELLRHYCPCSLDPHQGPSTSANELVCLVTSSRTTPLRRTTQSQNRSRLKNTPRKTQSQLSACPHYDNVVELACSTAHVSAFCQAVLPKIIPDGFWGEGDTMDHNKKLVLRKVDHFIKLRRFETMSLHEIIQGFKVFSSAKIRPQPSLTII